MSALRVNNKAADSKIFVYTNKMASIQYSQ